MNSHEFEIYIELYKRGAYESIPIGAYPGGNYFYMTEPQIVALKLLNDNKTLSIGYGGSARSGKSIIECSAMIFECFAYSGIAWGLARKELTVLKRTVLLTLFKQLNFYGITEKDYIYSTPLSKITFKNKSEIFLIDTAYKPSDPLNLRFGGFELTRCAIDESNETNVKVINKLLERTGWRKNEDYGLKRKTFECFNPSKNHIYTRFYKPYKNKTEPEYKKFIPALPGDNPNPAVQEWVEDMLKAGDKIDIQRQVYGNFEYDDDPSVLVDYDAVCDMFTNSHAIAGAKKISSDLAMQGRDRFLAAYWEGLRCSIEIDQEKSTGKSIELDLKELKTRKGVGNTQIIADADGIGNYLESYINNITTFRGGAAPKNKDEFYNIKSELAWALASAINKREIYIQCTSEQEEAIKEEISMCLKRLNVDGDVQKKRLIAKDTMKQLIGHSPDYLDVLIMGMHPGRKIRRGQRVL